MPNLELLLQEQPKHRLNSVKVRIRMADFWIRGSEVVLIAHGPYVIARGQCLRIAKLPKR